VAAVKIVFYNQAHVCSWRDTSSELEFPVRRQMMGLS